MDIRRVLEDYRIKGGKVTPQRLAVLEVLEGNRTHPSAAEVVARVRERYPYISQATVYRILAELVEMGHLEALEFGGATRFDPYGGDHAHFYCRSCGRVADVSWNLPGDALPPGILEGFRVEETKIAFLGLCPDCLSRGRRS